MSKRICPYKNDERATPSASELQSEDLSRKATTQEKDNLQKGLLDGTIPHIAAMKEVNIDQTVAVEKNNETIYRIPLSGEYTDVDYILAQTSNNTIERVAETHITSINSNDARTGLDKRPIRVWQCGPRIGYHLLDSWCPRRLGHIQ